MSTKKQEFLVKFKKKEFFTLNRLKELRKNKALTQKQVAQAIGVSAQSYGYYENWINKPDPETLSLLADFFEVSVDYLIGRSDDFGNITIAGTGAELPKDEQRLLSAFRSLSAIEKEKLIDDAEFYAKRYNSDTKTRKA